MFTEKTTGLSLEHNQCNLDLLSLREAQTTSSTSRGITITSWMTDHDGILYHDESRRDAQVCHHVISKQVGLGIESRTSATATAIGIEGVNNTTLSIPTLPTQLFINSRWLAVVTTVRNSPETESIASP
jgi:hypothetical protein